MAWHGMASHGIVVHTSEAWHGMASHGIVVHTSEVSSEQDTSMLRVHGMTLLEDYMGSAICSTCKYSLLPRYHSMPWHAGNAIVCLQILIVAVVEDGKVLSLVS